MKVIAEKLWREPAAVIGLLVSLGLLVANLIGDPDWSAQAIIAIIAPFASALGIRQLVMPSSSLDEMTAPAATPGTTYKKVPK